MEHTKIKFVNGSVIETNGDNTRESKVVSADSTGRYIFTDYGRLLKQYWKCDRCQGIFYSYVEVCPCCKHDAEPFNGEVSTQAKLVKWDDSPTGWARLRINPNSYCGYLLENVWSIE